MPSGPTPEVLVLSRPYASEALARAVNQLLAGDSTVEAASLR